jgi:4,5-DOPA dioxygenase extradiol
MDTTTLPPVFVSHGSPMIALEPREAGAFMACLGPVLTQTFGRPKAVLVASAHSLTREPVLLAAARHSAVYDFGGFDPKLQTLRYDAPGAPALAEQVARHVQAAGMPVHVLDQGGLDHGIWTPLRYLFPDADIPVLPLAWPPHWTPAQLLALGQVLAPLAAQGVWVLGSGSITHNLQRVFAAGRTPDIQAPATPESTAFREWFAQHGARAQWSALLDYRKQAPYAALMHPSDEHLLPFFVAAGTAAAQDPALPVHETVAAVRVHASLTFGDLGMDAYAFGPLAERLHLALAV